ncbi:MAG: transposase [Saprospiraceae bacterium]
MKIEYRRKLPHKFYPGYTFFITWSLKGAIPPKVFGQMIAYRDGAIREIETAEHLNAEEKLTATDLVNRKHFLVFNERLDNVHPESPLWLKTPEVAQIVANRLHMFDNKYYRLLAYCIMANHVHGVFDYSVQLPEDGIIMNSDHYKQVHQVMKLINGATAVQANRILDRSGKFWADSYFDRYIRDEKHLYTAINYTLQNPVKAGLCREWTDYRFSYCAL